MWACRFCCRPLVGCHVPLAPKTLPHRAAHPPPATDVPGLLEGAHAGVGLGHQFLRHCQRCRLLVHVVDGTSPDPMGDYRAIRQELELFNPQLAAKPQVGWGGGGGWGVRGGFKLAGAACQAIWLGENCAGLLCSHFTLCGGPRRPGRDGPLTPGAFRAASPALATQADVPSAACLHLPSSRCPALQIVAYNKMDVPDSSDYWEDVREQLAGEGVAQDAVFAIRWGPPGAPASARPQRRAAGESQAQRAALQERAMQAGACSIGRSACAPHKRCHPTLAPCHLLASAAPSAGAA